MPHHPSAVTAVVLASAVGLGFAGVLTGCGGADDPSAPPAGAIARVGDEVVTKDQFARLSRFQRMRVTQQITGGGLFEAERPELIPFDPPYTECVSRTTAAIPKAQRAQVASTQVEEACRNTVPRLKAEAVQQLLAAAVIEQEAKARDLVVSEDDVTKALPAAYQQEIGGEGNLGKFRTLTGLDVADFRVLVRQSLVFAKVLRAVADDAGPVTDEDVRAQYDEHRERYARPEQRELHVVVAKDEADARAALGELRNGATFASVVQKYSTDAETKKVDGKLSQIRRGQLEQVVEDAVFSTAASELAGPVRGERGWYVVRVDKVTPAEAVPFDRLKAVLRAQLVQTKPQAAAIAWQGDLQDRWKPRTTCAEGYAIVPLCGNAPASVSTPPTATTTGPAPAAGQ